QQNQEDNRLSHGREAVPDQHCRRDQPIGDEPAKLEPGRGWRKRADSQRIEEIRDCAKNDSLERGPCTARNCRPHQDQGEPENSKRERNQERNQHGCPSKPCMKVESLLSCGLDTSASKVTEEGPPQ